jgi:hypothetical protein
VGAVGAFIAIGHPSLRLVTVSIIAYFTVGLHRYFHCKYDLVAGTGYCTVSYAFGLKEFLPFNSVSLPVKTRCAQTVDW